MINQEHFQKALTEDLNSIGNLKVKTLSAGEVYWPYFKTMGSIYLILCCLGILVVELCVFGGFHLNRNSLWSIMNASFLYNLIPVIFLMLGFSHGFIIWRAIKSQLKSTPFIQELMYYFLQCYCILYSILLLVFVVVLRCEDLTMIFPFTSLLSMVLFMFFFNMENQRLWQGVLIDQLVILFSSARAVKNRDKSL